MINFGTTSHHSHAAVKPAFVKNIDCIQFSKPCEFWKDFVVCQFCCNALAKQGQIILIDQKYVRLLNKVNGLHRFTGLKPDRNHDLVLAARITEVTLK